MIKLLHARYYLICNNSQLSLLFVEVLKEYQDNFWPKGPPKPSPTESKNEEEYESTFSAVFSDPESSEEEDDSDSDQ